MDDKGTKRKPLSLDEKVRLIREVASGKRQVEVAAENGVPVSTLKTLVRSKERIRTAASTGTLPKWNKKSTPQDKVERKLFYWFMGATQKGITVSGPIIQKKALQLAGTLGCNDFRASHGWLYRFQERYNVVRKALHEQEASEKREAIAWKMQNIDDVMLRYEPSDVYSAEETGLFFSMLPKRVPALKGERCHNGQLSKMRVTILLCTNIKGTDKRPPVVIGESKQPRCFTGTVRMSIKYFANSKSWITQAIFEKWLKDFDEEMGYEGRKICLFLEETYIHQCLNVDLSNIELKVFPTDCTVVLRPLRRTVIRCIKRAYRQQVIERLLMDLRIQRETKINIFVAMEMLSEAWATMRVDTIISSFGTAGFLPYGKDMEDEADSKNEHHLASWRSLHEYGAVPRGVTLDDFVDADAALVTRKGRTATVSMGVASTSKSYEDEEDCLSEVPTVSQARDALNILRSFAGREGLGDILDPIARLEVTFMCISRLTQTKLTDYFVHQ